jgi:hypothetical protein
MSSARLRRRLLSLLCHSPFPYESEEEYSQATLPRSGKYLTHPVESFLFSAGVRRLVEIFSWETSFGL